MTTKKHQVPVGSSQKIAEAKRAEKAREERNTKMTMESEEPTFAAMLYWQNRTTSRLHSLESKLRNLVHCLSQNAELVDVDKVEENVEYYGILETATWNNKNHQEILDLIDSYIQNIFIVIGNFEQAVQIEEAD